MFYILQEYDINGSYIFSHCIKIQDLTLSCAHIAPTSTVCTTAMLVLLMIGNLNLQRWLFFSSGMLFVPRPMKIHCLGVEQTCECDAKSLSYTELGK